MFVFDGRLPRRALRIRPTRRQLATMAHLVIALAVALIAGAGLAALLVTLGRAQPWSLWDAHLVNPAWASCECVQVQDFDYPLRSTLVERTEHAEREYYAELVGGIREVKPARGSLLRCRVRPDSRRCRFVPCNDAALVRRYLGTDHVRCSPDDTHDPWLDGDVLVPAEPSP